MHYFLINLIFLAKSYFIFYSTTAYNLIYYTPKILQIAFSTVPNRVKSIRSLMISDFFDVVCAQTQQNNLTDHKDSYPITIIIILVVFYGELNRINWC